VLVAPYDTTEGEVLWAVIPLRNESGTSVADALAISDAVVAAAQQVRGVRCLPLNRSIEAMRALGLKTINTEAEARQLAQTLGVDGVLAGSVTAYDPYDPPVLGLSLALYAQPGSLWRQRGDMPDPYRLSRSYTDQGSLRAALQGAPVTVASEHYDGKDHGVQLALRSYAEGRTRQPSALGWRVYLKSMALYTEFASHETVRRLLEEEWLRLSRMSVAAERDND
jgi:hypothetical protein